MMLPGCLCVSTQLLVSDGFLKGAGLVLASFGRHGQDVDCRVDVPVPVPMKGDLRDSRCVIAALYHLTGFGLTPSKTHLVLFCECFGWSDRTVVIAWAQIGVA